MTKQTSKTKRLLRRQLRRPRRKRFQRPTLTFTPTAWAKLCYLRDLGSTEVGAFGIADADNLLRVQEIQLVQQRCTTVTVKFDDTAVADFFDAQVDQGRRPEQFGRIWIHTHPGNCPRPSSVDRRTFQRCFGRCDWAVMLILARNDSTSAELHWRQGDARLPMSVEIDYSRPFPASEFSEWKQEYEQLVHTDERHHKDAAFWIFDDDIDDHQTRDSFLRLEPCT